MIGNRAVKSAPKTVKADKKKPENTRKILVKAPVCPVKAPSFFRLFPEGVALLHSPDWGKRGVLGLSKTKRFSTTTALLWKVPELLVLDMDPEVQEGICGVYLMVMVTSCTLCHREPEHRFTMYHNDAAHTLYMCCNSEW